MKFTLVLILFNGIILFFIGLVSIMPFFMGQSSFADFYWQSGWPLLAVMLLFLGAMDAFALFNRRLFALLEREDWPALAGYLEDRVIRKGHYSPLLVKILSNAYLALSDFDGITELENKTAQAKPGLLETNALAFGAARLLSKDFSGALRFYAARLEKAKEGTAPWLRWYYGFSLFLDRRFSEAADQFAVLARLSPDALTAGLSAFFLTGSLVKTLPERKEELSAAAAEGRERVRKSLPSQENWGKEEAKLRAEVHGAILSTYFTEAAAWIYGS